MLVFILLSLLLTPVKDFDRIPDTVYYSSVQILNSYTCIFWESVALVLLRVCLSENKYPPVSYTSSECVWKGPHKATTPAIKQA